MCTVSSRGNSDQSTVIDPAYETYEMQRSREIGEQRSVLQNELLLLYRTCENIALWNCGTIGSFPRYVIVVGFRYTPGPPRSLAGLRYFYDGHRPKLLLSSYTSSHEEVELHTLERGLPRELIAVEPLAREIANVQGELRRLERQLQTLVSYAPGGKAYRRLVRRAAQHGMTRYYLRKKIRKPLRYTTEL